MGQPLVGSLRTGAGDGAEKPQDDLGARFHKTTVYVVFDASGAGLSQFGLAGEHNAEVKKVRM